METPSDFIALSCGASFAFCALHWCFERAAATHFFEDTFGIKFCFETFESAVYRLTFFDCYSTHIFLKKLLV